MKFPIACLFGRTTGRIALDQVKFTQGRVAFLAIGQLAGQAGQIKRTFTPGHLPGLSGGLAGPCRLDDLDSDGARFGRIFLEEFAEFIVNHRFHDALYLG